MAPAGPALGLATGGLPSELELDRAVALGCERVEVGLRWGESHLLDAAGRAVESCAARQLEPAVVLHVGGDEDWTALDVPDRFAAWAETVATALDGRGCRSWMPLARPNERAVRRHLGRGLRSSTRDLLRALDHGLAAHVLAVTALRRADPAACITLGLGAHRVYELDQLSSDVVLAPAAGVDRADIGRFLRQRRADHDAAQDAAGPVPPRQLLHRRLARSVIPLEQALPRAIDAAYAADGPLADRVRRDAPPVSPLPFDLPIEADARDEATATTGPVWDPAPSVWWR